jgi:hypothetical protein
MVALDVQTTTMNQFIYEPIPEYDRDTAIQEMESGVTERLTRALLALAFYDSDWRFVQSLCIKNSKDADENIRGIAILCLGHLARIHRALQTEIAVPAVVEALEDSSNYVRGCAGDTLDDIMIFCSGDKYERATALERLKSKRIDDVLLALFAIAKNEVDSEFAQAKCVEYAHHPDEVIRGQALKGFATIAYEHRKIDLDQIMPILEAATRLNGYAGECARSTIECVETYIEADEDV